MNSVEGRVQVSICFVTGNLVFELVLFTVVSVYLNADIGISIGVFLVTWTLTSCMISTCVLAFLQEWFCICLCFTFSDLNYMCLYMCGTD